MIPQRDISRIANGLLKPRGRRVPEAVIERDYCLAWFLTGLAQQPFAKTEIRDDGREQQHPSARWRLLLICVGNLCPGGMVTGTTGGYPDYMAQSGQNIKRR